MTDRKIKQSGDRNVNAQTVIGKIDTGDKTYLPPPITVSALHQLPSPPAHFTGRSDELNQLLPLLERGGALIVGVRGMSGVGKTALAIVLSHQVKDRYPDAQFFLDLQGASDKPMTVAAALSRIISSFYPDAKLPEDEAQLQATYLSLLHEKRALVVLDNAPPNVSLDRLMPPPSCALLVTSQFNVVMRGLQAVPLDELPPDKAREYLLKVTPRIGEYADELARLCGYLPLALELVAGALQVRDELEPADYARRLEREPLRELDAVAAAFALSYGLLNVEQQLRWRTLAVFPNTFDTYAAAAVWEIADLDDALDMLSALKGYSLMSFDTTTRRWRLHDLLRLSAAGHLDEAERAQFDQRHAVHYCNVLHEINKLYKQGHSAVLQGLNLYDKERENILIGQTLAATDCAQYEQFAQLCIDYANNGAFIIELRLNPPKRIRWLMDALVAAQALHARNDEGYLLNNLGIAYKNNGELSLAIECYERRLVLAREEGDLKGEGKTLSNIGNIYLISGDPQKAITYYTPRIEIAEKVADHRGKAIALCNLGNAYSELDDYPSARTAYSDGLRIFQEIGDQRGESHTLGNLGSTYFLLGDTNKSIKFYKRAAHISHILGDRHSEGIALWNLSLSMDKRGDRTNAIAHAEAALRIYEKIEDHNAEKVRQQLAEWRKENDGGDTGKNS